MKKTFALICRQKIIFIPFISGDNAKICELVFSTFGMFDYTHPTWPYQLVEDFDFICMPKINFIIHFFLEIWSFKESSNLSGWQHFGLQLENQNFARYGITGEISITISVLILDYLQEKLILPKYGQKWSFLEKRALSVFKYSSYLPRAKIKKYNEPFLRKMANYWVDRQRSRQMGRQ